MSSQAVDFNWLERHIVSAISEVNTWPAWKSQGTTLRREENEKSARDNEQPKQEMK
jgi:hypothetical protein